MRCLNLAQAKTQSSSKTYSALLLLLSKKKGSKEQKNSSTMDFANNGGPTSSSNFSGEDSSNHKKKDKTLTSKTIIADMMGAESEEMSQKGHGSGIVAEFKRTIGTHWIKEMTNFNQKTIAVSFFLFFAAVAPAITFGAIYAKVTHNYMGPVEMILATAWCGIFYALVGGMPIVSIQLFFTRPYVDAQSYIILSQYPFQMINGGTGPVLAFSGVLYKMSESMDVPFLTFNAWVGLWV